MHTASALPPDLLDELHALLGERETDPVEPNDAVTTTDRHQHAGSPATDVPELARSAAMLNGKRLDEVIRLNGAVKAGIEEWLTWMRPNLLDAYENYQYLRHRMWPEYEKAGLPEALLFGIMAKESGGKVHAVSRAGAAGLLQFMPATARGYGLGRASGFDDRFDPALITRANVAYLNDRFRELNNDLELALGAYNGGEGGVMAERRLCAQASGCDPGVWFGHVEQHSTKSRVRWHGYGASAFDINRTHVRNVMLVRRPRYVQAMGA